jgi:acetyl esterase/lipase
MPADDVPPVSRRTLLAGLAALTTAACSRAIFLAVNVPASFGNYTRHADLSYGASSAHKLDVFVPDEPAGGPRPLVVFWYGGRWTDGDKGDYKFVGAALAALGYVAVLPNYRHYPEVKMAGFMDDAARAAQWAVEHGAEYGADPKRLYLMGHSAGAHIAALVTLDTRYFAATGRPVPVIAGMIGLSGPYDFLPLTDTDLQDMFGPPENYPNSQPINFVRSNPPGALESGVATLGEVPAMLLIVGLKDEAVLPKNTLNLAAALQRHGVPVTLKTYPKLKHADTVAAMSLPARGRAPTVADIAAFVGGQPAVSRPPSS